MSTKYQDACQVIVDTAKRNGASDADVVANALAETDPLRQYKALQDGLRGLCEDAKKNEVIATEDLFSADIPSHVSVHRQKWYVRNLAIKVCEVIEREFPETPPSPANPPADPPKKNPAPEESDGTGGEDKPPVGEKKHVPGNGRRKNRPAYTPQHWLHIVYASKLRDLLTDAQMWGPCSALNPPVNLAEKRFPRNLEEAKQLSADALQLAFNDLERATIGLLKRPSLDHVVRLNRGIRDLQRRILVDRFLTYVSEKFRPAVGKLVKTQDEEFRTRAMMLEPEITNEIVGMAWTAYEALIRADAAAPKPVIEVVSPPAQAGTTASPPSTETQPAAAEPATGGAVGAGTSGPQPVLPRRQPPDKPFSFGQDPGTQGEREEENMNGQKDSATGGTQNAISAAVSPAPAAKQAVKEFVDKATLDNKLGEVQEKVTQEVREAFNTLVQDHLPALVKKLQPPGATPPVTGQATVGLGTTSDVGDQVTRQPLFWERRENRVIAGVVAILVVLLLIAVWSGTGEPVQDQPLFTGPTLEERLQQIPPEDETAETPDQPQV